MKEFNLKNKNILITGSNGLIGKNISEALSRYGANLILVDNVSKNLITNQANKIIKKYNSEVIPIQLDITDEKKTKIVLRKFNKIDVLINLAAIDPKINKKNVYDFNNSSLKKSIDVNIIGTCLFTDFILKKMIKNKKGNIINVASTYSIVSPNMNLYKGTNTFQINKPIEYIISKSFIPNYSRYIATTYIKKGIRCNTVVPHAVIKNNKNKIFKTNFSKLSPMGRFCKPTELNGLFVFLSSDSSSYMNGSTITIDGGWTAW